MLEKKLGKPTRRITNKGIMVSNFLGINKKQKKKSLHTT